MLTEFLAQREDMHVDRSAAAREVPSPHVLQQCIAGKGDAGVFHEMKEQVELARRKRKRLAAAKRLVAHLGDGKRPDRYLVARPLGALVAPIGGAAQQGTHAGNHLHHAVRLGEVLVGAAVEGGHNVELGAFRGHHDHGHARKARGIADAMEDFQPVGAGQHDVEHDHIGKAARAGRTELHVVRHALGLNPRLREGVKCQLADARVVFHAVHHSLPPSLAENPYPVDYRTEGRVQARVGSPAHREERGGRAAGD